MGNVTAQLVKELRERTGAGMMDCKKALEETQANIEEAIDWLRKKGLAAAAKKSARIAAEGVIALCVDGLEGSVIEVNAETDFVSRNEKFQDFAIQAAKISLHLKGNIEEIKEAFFPADQSQTVQGALTNLIAVIGENMALRRADYLSVSDGVITAYIHNSIGESGCLGRVGVLVALESTASDKEALQKAGRAVAMHIAAAHPQAVSIESVDPALVERERSIFREQALASGKPAEFVDKMVEGRIRKFYEESILLEQIYLIDDSKRKVSKVLEDLGQTLGAPVKLVDFIHFKLGDGIEKQASDFAAEVAGMTG